MEGPVLITGLTGTGSDPEPGPQRRALLADMEAHNVANPNKILSSPNNSLAWARAFLPPAARKGDPLDVEVRVPAQSETSSIRGGFMMETRLKEMAVLAGQVKEGHVYAVAEGPVLVDPASHDAANNVAQLRGLVLGGGKVLKARTMGLVLRESDKSVFLSKQIGDALNRRFHTYSRGIKQGVATPKTDAFIELEVHPRYKYNLGRYLQVVRSVALFESPQQQLARLELLERQLQDPVTSALAAVRLEAIGKEGVRVLKKGLEAKDPEVQFYSAEALAYLDESCSVAVLKQAAQDEPAFRAFALTALCALNDVPSADALRDLFDVPSAETRYGAFRALWAMNEHDPQLRGEHLGEKFWLHVVPSAGPAMVHVTHSYRPEVVLFGENQQFRLPLTLEAGNAIIVKSQPDGKIRISRFRANQSDQRRVVDNSVAEVVRGIVEIGGDYPDVVQALQEAKAAEVLLSRFEVDAIPERGRIYDRNRQIAHATGSKDAKSTVTADDADDNQNEHQPSSLESSRPLPDLFGGGAPSFSSINEHALGDRSSDQKSEEEPPESTAQSKDLGVK
ncbi:MAG TPA: flagellar basal body P-ring protein FlgI [Pirellulales bacterium]